MTKRILHFIGDQIARAAAIAVMLALTVGAMMYLRGYFDFTFIDRVPLNAAAETETAEPEDTAPPVTEETQSPVTEDIGSDTEALSPSQSGTTVTEVPAQRGSWLE